MRCTGLVAMRPGPQHVGRVQHHWPAGRSTSVAYLATGGHRLRLQPGGQHLVDSGLLEAVQQFADGLVDAGNAGDRCRCRG